MSVEQKWVSARQSAGPEDPPAPPQALRRAPSITSSQSHHFPSAAVSVWFGFFFFIFSHRRENHLPAELHYYEKKKNKTKKKKKPTPEIGKEREPALLHSPLCGMRVAEAGGRGAEAGCGRWDEPRRSRGSTGGETAEGRRGAAGGGGPAAEGVPRRRDLPAGLPPTSLPRPETKWRPDGAGAEAAPRRSEPGRRRRQRRRR